jgi:AraC-like DNA-binding protein
MKNRSGQLGLYYSAFEQAGERLRSIWEDPDGLAFIERERTAPGEWSGPKIEADGRHHFFVQTVPHVLLGERDGVALQRQAMPAGAVRAIWPGQSVRATGVGAFKSFQVTFTEAFVTDHLASLVRRPTGFSLYEGSPRHDIGLGELAMAYELGTNMGLAPDALYLHQVRVATLRRLLRFHSNRLVNEREFQEGLPPARVRRVVNYIEDHLSATLSLNELASLAGVSKFHFARAFANAMGTSPHAFVMLKRLQYALSHSQSTRLTIADIARGCGFSDHAHFSRAFKTRFGCSPSELRAR